MKKSTFALLVSAAAIMSTGAYAGDKDKKKDWNAKIEQHFAEVDANGDGNISEDEFLAYKSAKASEYWGKMAEGAGDDGMISLDEMKAMHKAKMEKKKKMKKEM